MPTPTALGLKFFVISGAILMISGVMQIFFRQRPANETHIQRYVNGATIRALVFGIVGLLGILIGLGVIPMLRL